MSSPVLTQLLLSKHLYLKGIDALRPDDDLSTGIAVSLFHDAAEMLMWDVVKQKRIKVSDKESFPDLLKKIKDSDPRKNPNPAIPDGMMLDLNKVRVAYKHNGISPAYSMAVRCQAYADEFLRAVTAAFFETDFESLSLADLVGHQEVREFIKAAEGALQKNEFTECLITCAKAEFIASGQVELLIPSPSEALGWSADNLPGVPNALIEYLRVVRLTAVAALLRLNLPDYSKFRQLMPSVARTDSGKFHTNLNRSRYTRQDAEFCIRYVVDYALTVERQLGFPVSRQEG